MNKAQWKTSGRGKPSPRFLRKLRMHWFSVAALTALLTPLANAQTAGQSDSSASHPGPSATQDDSALPGDLTEVGLKKLLTFDLVVTSAGKKEQTLSETASAVYVITNEDIRRSGATHVAEALRLVPGVSVARVSSSKWAISIRGFNQVFANKLLVLLDGVSVFSPITNGVYWETNEIVLDDVERIEVIRGPGAALWGENAVNGVINIITKRTKQTQGLLASGGGGNEERGFGSLRYGGTVGDDTTYRVFGRYADRASNELKTGGDADDGWEIISGGLRAESKLSAEDTLFVGGETFGNSTEIRPQTPSLDPPYVDSESFSGQEKWKGGMGSVKWRREMTQTSSLEAHYSYRQQTLDSTIIHLDYNVSDADFQHRFTPFAGNDVVYGVEYQHFWSATEGTFAESTNPPNRQKDLVSCFVQDEIALIENQLHFILGSKFEHNVATGNEVMPNARLIWTPDSANSIWLAVSRAVAPPSLVFEDVQFPIAAIPASDGSPEALVTAFGSRKVESEDVLSYELGARSQLSPEVSVDFATFYNRYSDVYSFEGGTPYFGTAPGADRPTVVIPVLFDNALDARSIGFEVSLDWHPTNWARLAGGYSFIDIGVDQGDSTDSGDKLLIEEGTPRNQLNARVYLTVAEDFELSFLPRYVSHLGSGDIDGYAELDSGVLWHVRPNLELALFGQNLLHDHHEEFVGNIFGPPETEIKRGFYAKATLHY
ncbi:MAG: TonB-dependent receptor plug domain-containing protein [Bdellovibrionota bacterium]